MFVQFIEGAVADREAFHQQMERWLEQCAPGADGWLGSTAGVSTDGTGFVAARFESTEAARANSDRPEQSAWWEETASLFRGEVSFEDADDIDVLRGGGSDAAGFVQVIRGQVNDIEAGRSMMTEEMPTDARPDVIGGIVGLQPDGTYTMVVYFTSEEEARAGESSEADADDEEFAEQMAALHPTPPRYLDLDDPWTWSPS